MKEIKKKIKDSVLGEFNKELIGDKVKLQNKVNELQRMIDMINVLQPLEDEFILPEQYYFLCETELEFEAALNYFKKKYKDNFKYKSKNGSYMVEGNGYYGFHNNTDHYKEFTEITFKQFKKYVLNEN